MVKAVTFDLFDTLAPAAGFHRNLQQALYGFINQHVAPVTFERYVEVERAHMAQRFDRICRTLEEVVYNDRFAPLFKDLSGREPEKDLVEKASEKCQRTMAESIEVSTDTRQFLERLSSRYKLGLISNFPVSGPIYEGLERAGIRQFFGAVTISSDFGLIKPHPAIFHEMADKLEVEPTETVHLGDDWVCDVLGAANFGSVPVYVTQFIDEEKVRLSGMPEHMKLLCSHVQVDPELEGVTRLDDITRLPEILTMIQ